MQRLSAHRTARLGGALGPVPAHSRLTDTRRAIVGLTCVGLILTGLTAALMPGASAAVPPPAIIALPVATGSAGQEISVDLSLVSPDAAGLQVDLGFDRSVALLAGFSAAGRASALSSSLQEVEAGRTRLILYSDDASVIPDGSGTVGTLTFRLVGEREDATDLLLSEMVLSDESGGELAVVATDGSLSIDQDPAISPELQLAVLPNPGNPRWLQIMVEVRWGSVTGPTVTANGTAVAMGAQSERVFMGQYVVPESSDSVTIIATDSNAAGSSTAQEDLNYGGKDHDVD